MLKGGGANFSPNDSTLHFQKQERAANVDFAWASASRWNCTQPLVKSSVLKYQVPARAIKLSSMQGSRYLSCSVMALSFL